MPSSTPEACESSARHLATPSRRADSTLRPYPPQRTMANSMTVVGPLLNPRGKEDNVLILSESSHPPPPPEPSEQRLVHPEIPTTTTERALLVSTKPATLLTRTRLAGAAEPTPTTPGAMDDAPYAPPLEPVGSTTVDLPRYQNGVLLAGDCASAQYTLVDDGEPTMIYAPFVGCINDKPDCCPFTPINTVKRAKAVVVATPGVFPSPQNREDATVKSCAPDYYSIAGGCCPSGFTPWTSAMGGQTPCISPLTATTEVPPITNAPTVTTTKPTMAVTDVVFAMQYPLEEASGALSGGTIAGIVIGIIMGVFLLAALIFFICRCRRRKQLESFKKELHQNFYGESGTGTSEVPTLVNNTNANSIRGSTTTTMAHNQRQSSLYGAQYLHHNTIKRDSAASVRHKEQRGSPRTDNSVEPYTPDSAYPQRPQTREAIARRESAHTITSELSFPDDDFYDNIPPTPGTPGTLADGNPNHNNRSNNNPTHDGVVSGSELHLAKPQRLSRGYPRIVYTHSHGHGSNTSVPGTEHGGSGISGGETSGAGRPSTSTSSSVSGLGSICSRPPTRLDVMPGTPEEDNRESKVGEREKIGAAS